MTTEPERIWLTNLAIDCAARHGMSGLAAYVPEAALTAAGAEVARLKADTKQGAVDYCDLMARHDHQANEIARLREALGSQTAAARDVLAERQRQISGEGWTPEHDDAHSDGEMAGAAACYAMQVALDCIGRNDLHNTVSRTIRELWPWSAHWWKPKNRRADLIKAAALILAEIERLDRAALRKGGAA